MNVELYQRVDASLDAVELMVKEYCCHGRSIYSPILTELRKLLADRNAVRSYDRNSAFSNLYEMCYGSDCYVDDFGANGPGPLVCASPMDLIYHGTRRRRLVKIGEWLNWPVPALAYTGRKKKRRPRSLPDAISALAGVAGAHMIKDGIDAIGPSASIALSSKPASDMSIEEIAELPYQDAWYNFVVDVAIRLLNASGPDGRWIRPHTLPIVAKADVMTLTLQAAPASAER